MSFQLDQSRLIDLIDRARFCDTAEANDAVRSVFRGTVAELCKYTERKLSQIQNAVLYADEKEKIGEIVFALANSESDTDWESLGLFPVLNGDVFFIDADYGEVKKYIGDEDTDRTYEGKYWDGASTKSFRYYLQFNKSLLNQSDIVERLESIYGTCNAVPYSPFLRKAVKICIIDELPQKIREQIDAHPEECFLFSENGLPLLDGKRLLWNLSVSTEDREANGKTPYDTIVKYSFHFSPGKNGLIKYAIPNSNQALVYESRVAEHGTDLVINKDYDSFVVVEHHPVNWNDLEIKKLRESRKIFTNRIDRNILLQKRILSDADIEFAIQPFRSNEGIICRTASDLEAICPRYSLKYCSKMQKRVGFQKLKTVKLWFEAQERPKYFSDYINYALSFLDYYYPEIEWVGGW